jgi:hypothetical protein
VLRARRSGKGGRSDVDVEAKHLGPLRLAPIALRLDTARWWRVKKARARIARRFYDREEVREKVLDAILDELTRH